MNTLERFNLGTRKPFGGKITTLLAQFGVCPRRNRHPNGHKSWKANFLAEHSHELEWMYHDARENYREQMKRAHPDTGGSNEEARRINAAWARVELWFSRHCSKAMT